MKQTFSEMVQDELGFAYDVAVSIEDIEKNIASVNENVDHPYADETASKFDAMEIADAFYVDVISYNKYKDF